MRKMQKVSMRMLGALATLICITVLGSSAKAEAKKMIMHEETLKTGTAMTLTIPADTMVYVPYVTEWGHMYADPNRLDQDEYTVEIETTSRVECQVYKADMETEVWSGWGANVTWYRRDFYPDDKHNQIKKGDTLYIAISNEDSSVSQDVSLMISYEDYIVDVVDEANQVIDIEYTGCGNLISSKCNWNGRTIRNVTVGEGFVSFNSDLFAGAEEVEEVVLPASLKSIARDAFLHARKIKKVTFAPGTKDLEIGYHAFQGCTMLEEIELPDVAKIGYGIFEGCTGLKRATLQSISSDCDMEAMFMDCESLEEFVIPDGVKRIGANQFRGCSSLTKVVIPDSVEEIGEVAFLSDTSLKEMILPKNLKRIEASAFRDCYSLEKVHYPGSTEKWLSLEINHEYGNRILWEVIESEEKASQTIDGQTEYTVTYSPDGYLYDVRIFVTSNGNGEIVYSSSDETVAKVMEGQYLWTEGAGDCVIYAKAKESGLYDESDLLEIIVHVEKATIEVDTPWTFPIEYDGKEHELVCAMESRYGTYYYSLDGIHFDKSVPKGKEVGNYTVYYKVVSTNPNYNDSEVHFVDVSISGNHKHTYTEKVVKPTCTKKGYTEYTCECGDTYKDNYVDALGHKEQKKITAATASTNGKITHKCKNCGKEMKPEETIYAAKTIKLSKTEYVYDGKAKKPDVIIKDSKGKVVDAKFYTVTYANGRTDVGQYGVKITFKTNYTGSKNLTFTICPKGTTIKSVKAVSKGFTVTWNKQAKQTDGYEIRYSTSKDFKTNVKIVKVNKNSTVSKKVDKLTASKKYYVQIRTYKVVNKKTYTSDWSKALEVTTKK